MDIIWNPAENIAISPSADASVCVRGLFCISKEVDLLQYPQNSQAMGNEESLTWASFSEKPVRSVSNGTENAG